MYKQQASIVNGVSFTTFARGGTGTARPGGLHARLFHAFLVLVMLAVYHMCSRVKRRPIKDDDSSTVVRMITKKVRQGLSGLDSIFNLNSLI